ncbi:HD-GYP domain-containing protein [Clostridium brassicae]|uniref:HD domain-containing protein n=1 Tax=Clostridium brassicae TaxID=2999072 RepID=A0ABT4DCJ6_9CLOT|nr:HD domain-containing phosphohydrolase [Clostridium brassicae]MCY6960042.1 HD domain-containing protein [Clostridium brassicae]
MLLNDFKVAKNESISLEIFLHSKRVSLYAKRIGKNMGYTSKQINYLILTALNHDIGKCRVPQNIINKNGTLSKDEYEIIKKHTQYGANILREYGYSKEFCEIIKFHHENFDGSGYYGLVGEKIPIASRIIHIVDEYDAMVSRRCYKKAYDEVAALSIIENEKFKYDPVIFQVFMSLINK